MKPSLKKWSAIAAIAGAAAGTAWLIANRRLFLVSSATTDPNPDYPDLRAHVYYARPDEALDAAVEAIRSLDRWRVVDVDHATQCVLAESESRFGPFLHDVTVTALALGRHHARVRIESRSREGCGDLGENANKIRVLQNSMDKLLTGG
jgi:uncharacterized protein (DUF1499 family)